MQIDANWYASTTALPVPTDGDSEDYGTYSQQISPAAAGWNELTLTGNGAVIGSPASTPLTGSLTGVGLVISHTDEGTFNIDNVEIRQ